MQTETENGKLMGLAIKAMIEMQLNCIKLFRDLDKELELHDLPAISDNTITTGLGNSLSSSGLPLAEYLYRFYAYPPKNSACHVLEVNIFFHNNYSKRYFAEPLFIAANVRYDPTQAAEPISTRAWDPCDAFLNSSDRSLGKVLEVAPPPRRNTIEKIALVAVPLYSITSIQSAIQAINMVGFPERNPSFPHRIDKKRE